MKLHIVCGLLGCSIIAAVAQEANTTGLLHQIAPERELLIIDPAVVDSPLADYPGPWSIGHLFDQLAEDGDGATLMRKWLESWTQDCFVNCGTVPRRPKMRELVIEPWQRADGWKPKGKEEWRPNLANAPFRLLAVINRMDLIELAPVVYGCPINTRSLTVPPEGRLVYAVLGPDGTPLGRHFTVIFEYEMTSSLGSIGGLARKWHELGGMNFDDRYFTQLESLTRRFTDRAKNGGRPPLGQVRTNDMALHSVCEMREFRMSKDGLTLKPSTLANTPSMQFARKGSRQNRVLASFIETNAKAAKDGSLEFPDNLLDRTGRQIAVLAGYSQIPSKRFHWASARITDPEARHNFSKRTCNGCHAGDTNTDFCHIAPRLRGEPAELSDFLRMDGRSFKIDDPARRHRHVASSEMQDRIAAFVKTLDPTLRKHNVEREVRKARATH